MVCDPLDAGTMYILRTGFSAGNKVWKTTDLGTSWINISGDLPDLPCSDLFIDPENNRELYLANDIGVYHSSDGGSTWLYDSQSMPYVPAIDFDYVKIGSVRYLRVGTHGRSIYQTLLPNYCLEQDVTFSSQEQIDNFKINYPGCKTIQGDVTISGNITNLNGLNVLSSIGGALIIKLNKRLTSLAGLENIDAGSIDSLFIYQNDSLSLCEVKSVCDYLARPGSFVFIDANAHGCNDVPEIELACQSTSVKKASNNQTKILVLPQSQLHHFFT